ncbi:hypothetical protein [Vibrio sp.]|uniref:hypothetical protein n=1 Tax=Vibrio sp. TaxID=678 RepID=UPI003D12FBDF
MSQQQFETLKKQLKLLSRKQLEALRGEINSKLDINKRNLLSDEEVQALAALFR